MSGINIKFISAIILGLMLGIYVLVEVLTARTSIGQLYLYVAVAALITGMLSPKPAMYLLGFCTIYIDFFKRLMVIGGTPTFLEVSYVLAIPPLLVAGALISVVLSLAFSRGKISRDVIVSFLVASVIACGSVLGVMFSTSDRQGLGLVGVMVNQGFYSYLVFLVPFVLPSDEDRRKYLHYLFVLLIPSVLYMFWQEHHGYAGFEYDYLSSGLSIEAKNLDESMGGEMRKFSTLNGCGTASTLYSIFMLVCFVSLRKANAKPSVMQKWGKVMLAPLFAMAAYFTISRTGWFSGLGTFAAYFLLGSKFRSKLGITIALGTFVTVVALAPIAIEQNWMASIESQLKLIVSQFTDDPTARRAIVLGTVGDRLQGWANLTTEPRLWTPFGFVAAGVDPRQYMRGDFRWGHDALIDTLMRFGYVTLTMIVSLASYCLYALFRYMYGLSRKSITFKITRLCLALNAGILVGAMSSGAQFRNFPQNVFFMLWIAIPFATYQQAMRDRKQARSAMQSDDLPGVYPEFVKARSSVSAPR
jgi:hypothetical protein